MLDRRSDVLITHNAVDNFALSATCNENEEPNFVFYRKYLSMKIDLVCFV